MITPKDVKAYIAESKIGAWEGFKNLWINEGMEFVRSLELQKAIWEFIKSSFDTIYWREVIGCIEPAVKRCHGNGNLIGLDFG